MSEDTTYNGWANRATWNVALWISNDYGLYCTACSWVRRARMQGRPVSYKAFCHETGLDEERTPDRIRFLSSGLCLNELDEMLDDLVDKEDEVTNELALAVLEYMAADMVEYTGSLSRSDPFFDVFCQRLEALHVAQNALQETVRAEVMQHGHA